MQVTLPDDQQLHERAEAAGFASVEEYVRKLVEREIRQEVVHRSVSDPEKQTAEEWVRDFDAWISTLTSHNPNFDDSRESIYPIR
jgi:hypothetical protein